MILNIAENIYMIGVTADRNILEAAVNLHAGCAVGNIEPTVNTRKDGGIIVGFVYCIGFVRREQPVDLTVCVNCRNFRGLPEISAGVEMEGLC